MRFIGLDCSAYTCLDTKLEDRQGLKKVRENFNSSCFESFCCQSQLDRVCYGERTDQVMKLTQTYEIEHEVLFSFRAV